MCSVAATEAVETIKCFLVYLAPTKLELFSRFLIWNEFVFFRDIMYYLFE